MTFMLISASAKIEVHTHKDLLAAWRLYGGPGTLVGSFTVRKPLTETQLRRLPGGLRKRLVEGAA
jgi:hypothetical protein